MDIIVGHCICIMKLEALIKMVPLYRRLSLHNIHSIIQNVYWIPNVSLSLSRCKYCNMLQDINGFQNVGNTKQEHYSHLFKEVKEESEHKEEKG